MKNVLTIDNNVDQFIGQIARVCGSKPVDIVNMNNQLIDFRVDTDAYESVIPESSLQSFDVKNFEIVVLL